MVVMLYLTSSTRRTRSCTLRHCTSSHVTADAALTHVHAHLRRWRLVARANARKQCDLDHQSLYCIVARTLQWLCEQTIAQACMWVQQPQASTRLQGALPNACRLRSVRAQTSSALQEAHAAAGSTAAEPGVVSRMRQANRQTETERAEIAARHEAHKEAAMHANIRTCLNHGEWGVVATCMRLHPLVAAAGACETLRPTLQYQPHHVLNASVSDLVGLRRRI